MSQNVCSTEMFTLLACGFPHDSYLFPVFEKKSKKGKAEDKNVGYCFIIVTLMIETRLTDKFISCLFTF